MARASRHGLAVFAAFLGIAEFAGDQSRCSRREMRRRGDGESQGELLQLIFGSANLQSSAPDGTIPLARGESGPEAKVFLGCHRYRLHPIDSTESRILMATNTSANVELHRD